MAFQSSASNLVANDTGGHTDISCAIARLARRRVSINTAGTGNDDSFDSSMSANGRYVAFDLFATNLVANDVSSQEDVFVRDARLVPRSA